MRTLFIRSVKRLNVSSAFFNGLQISKFRILRLTRINY